MKIESGTKTLSITIVVRASTTQNVVSICSAFGLAGSTGVSPPSASAPAGTASATNPTAARDTRRTGGHCMEP
jgi:hypothetical protein